MSQYATPPDSEPLIEECNRKSVIRFRSPVCLSPSHVRNDDMVACIGQRFDLVQPTVPEGGEAMQQDGLQALRIRSAILRCNRPAAQSKYFNSVVTGSVECCKGQTNLVSGLYSRRSVASPGFASAPLLGS
jgi:hypothetical protein